MRRVDIVCKFHLVIGGAVDRLLLCLFLASTVASAPVIPAITTPLVVTGEDKGKRYWKTALLCVTFFAVRVPL